MSTSLVIWDVENGAHQHWHFSHLKMKCEFTRVLLVVPVLMLVLQCSNNVIIQMNTHADLTNSIILTLHTILTRGQLNFFLRSQAVNWTQAIDTGLWWSWNLNVLACLPDQTSAGRSVEINLSNVISSQHSAFCSHIWCICIGGKFSM